MRSKARIIFFFALEEGPVHGVSGPKPAIRRLRRRGAGAVSREHSLLALGMGRIFTVFFVILVKKCALGDEAGELRSGEVVTEASRTPPRHPGVDNEIIGEGPLV